ncbi:MAG TPA: hypothetical protein VK726_01810 [Acetobacteraceae bacterium]|jgi:hypothetical protein|nr:hypothetical protein [Acetobacteraceae bacterium]
MPPLARTGLATLAVIASLAQAVALAQGLRPTNIGTASCDIWAADRREPDQRAAIVDAQWVIGFLSGIGNMHLGELEPLHGTDAPHVWAWIDAYCRDHPTDTIEQAAAAFAVAHPR